LLVNGVPISKDNFTKVIYDKKFKIPYKGKSNKMHMNVNLSTHYKKNRLVKRKYLIC
jgi:hypothetical protein